jgi:hypothetical protein
VRVDVKAEAGLPDGFGRPLPAAATGGFMTSRIASPPIDGGCGPLDAGTPDGGPGDDGGADAANDASDPDAT